MTERGSCRTCRYCIANKKEGDIFWTYHCSKKNESLDERTMNLLWICHEKKDNDSLTIGDKKKKRSIWKDKDDNSESIFDDHSADDMLKLMNSDIFGRYVGWDIALGRYVKKTSDGKIVEICDKEYNDEYKGASWEIYDMWKKEKEKRKGLGL